MFLSRTCLFGGTLIAAGLASHAIAQCTPQLLEFIDFTQSGSYGDIVNTPALTTDRLYAVKNSRGGDYGNYVDFLLTYDITDPDNPRGARHRPAQPHRRCRRLGLAARGCGVGAASQHGAHVRHNSAPARQDTLSRLTTLDSPVGVTRPDVTTDDDGSRARRPPPERRGHPAQGRG
ncbi:MAG: hypothetical protein AAGI53_14320 [Planctomycetota bacterium]